jgi:hypothetical protein
MIPIMIVELNWLTLRLRNVRSELSPSHWANCWLKGSGPMSSVG